VTDSSIDPICCPPLLSAPLAEAEAVELAALLKALADPARLRLVSIIAAAPSGEVCACDLTAPLDRSQPTVSHHLSQLVKAGILDREQRGRWAWFRLRDERLRAVGEALGGSSQSAVVESISTD
jgi:ArsR family transcriptional regulator, arsenate/arsenite/antimonite-responsive transcriptional repressor